MIDDIMMELDSVINIIDVKYQIIKCHLQSEVSVEESKGAAVGINGKLDWIKDQVVNAVIIGVGVPLVLSLMIGCTVYDKVTNANGSLDCALKKLLNV